MQRDERAIAREARGIGRVAARGGSGEDELSDEEEMRLMALNALLHMDSDRVFPILKKLLEDREGSSAALRARAVFILAQSEADGAEALLMDVIRHDPDSEVRQHAMFWLGQVPGDMAVELIEEILADESDPALRDRALFALGQSDSPRAGEILKRVAMDRGTSDELRAMAIFWIGQRDDEGTLRFLQDIFGSVEDPEIKERILFSVAQTGEGEAGEWLLQVALDEKQPSELRGRAVFWAGQMGELPVGKLVDLYRSMDSSEMREQILFTLAQQDEDEAAEAIMKLAKEETDPELKARAIFWIGQTDHPDAAAFLEAIITGD
jgi:HEAT repeat protein